MKAFKPSIIFICAFLFLLYGCSIFNTGDSNHSIQWAEEDLNDFVAYAFGPSKDSLAVIDLATGEILKKLANFQGIQSVASNNKGTFLYVSTGSGHAGSSPGFIYEVNTNTWERQTIYEDAAHLLTNKKGEIFFISKLNTDPTRIFGKINTANSTVSEIGTIEVDWTGFKDDTLIEIHPTQPLLYAINGEGELYQFNYETGEMTFLFPELSFPPLARLSLSGKGDSLFIPGGPILDLANNKIVDTIPVWRLGSIAARNDNKEIYITDPGGYARDPMPSGKVFVYSPREGEIIGEIEVVVDQEKKVTDLIYLTPKERYAIINDWLVNLFIIDLKERKLIKKYKFTSEEGLIHSIQAFHLATKPPSMKNHN